MSRPEDSCDAIDLIAAAVDTLAGIIENDIFCVDLVDRRASPPRAAFTKDVLKVPFQQGELWPTYLSPALKRFAPYEHFLLSGENPGYSGTNQ